MDRKKSKLNSKSTPPRFAVLPAVIVLGLAIVLVVGIVVLT